MAQLVYLVESDAELAALVASTLQRHELRVVTFQDGNELLVQQEAPALILLCIDPRRIGWAVCNRIKKSSLRSVPMIVTSAEASEKDFQDHQALRTRAEGYLRKPFGMRVLIEIVGTVLRGLAPPDAVTPLPAAAPIEELSSDDLMFDSSEISVEVLPPLEELSSPPRLAATPIPAEASGLLDLDAAFTEHHDSAPLPTIPAPPPEVPAAPEKAVTDDRQLLEMRDRLFDLSAANDRLTAAEQQLTAELQRKEAEFRKVLDGHSHELAQLEREHERTLQKLDEQYEGDLNEARQRATELEAKLAEAENRVTELEAKLAEAEKRATALEAKLAETEGRRTGDRELRTRLRKALAISAALLDEAE